ncbi:solute carrier family 22 member 1 [Drosophila grimshawi]|uniref:GH19611 n=1 Tax=Drosophila grimshawi TaxID=7222 RepID=B4K0W8_DROGR|nr:solute carrier family 22 member 1 [Drosophila grimshawi]EDV90843.1 GH19611 [Drosophila grimshawi]
MAATDSDYKRRMSTALPPGVDIVQHINGNFGRWQLRIILLIFLCKIPTAWFMAVIIYTAPNPQRGELICRPATWNGSAPASEHGENRNTDRLFSVQVCNAYAQSLSESFVQRYGHSWNATHASLPCERVEHNSDYKSLITQFDLICSRRVLVAVTQSFHALGTLMGGLLAYQLLRHFSPRRLMLLGMLGQIFCGNLTGLVDTYQLHVYFRCLTSVCCTLMYSAGHIILMDITAGKARILVVTLSELFWSIGLVLLPAISIYFDDWSYLYVAISSSLIVLVWLHRWISDAPRWLLRHQQIEPALRLLLESATHNNRMVPLTLDVQLKIYASELNAQKRQRYCQIWDKETKRRQLVYIHVIWGCSQILYNIILLMIRSLSEAHVHVNTAALGFAEMIGVFVGLYFILYTRRYWRWAGNLMIIAGLCTYLVWLLPEPDRNPRRVGLELILWMLLKCAHAASIAVLTTCTGEMVSPEKRVLLMFSVVSFARLCLVFSPMVSTLIVVHRLLPITIIATVGWIYGLIMCFLNRYYWNTEQQHVVQVPTPNTYGRNSAVILRYCSTSSSDVSGYSNDMQRNFVPNVTVSISDLWHINFHTIPECDSIKKATEGVIKSQSMHSI